MAKDRNPPETGAREAAQSETQRLLLQMKRGEAWSHQAAALGYMVGGNEGHFTAGNHSLDATRDEDD